MYLTLFAKLLLVLGGLNYLFISTINVDIFSYLTRYPMILRIIMLFIGLSALYFVFDRDYYLSFLGQTVIPIAQKDSKIVLENLKQIKLSGLPPNTTVLSWGAKESNLGKIFDSYIQAYGDYSNTIVSKTNEDGEVIIELPCPSSYYVPGKFGMMKRLNRHIHYRYELPKYKGMFSRVYTKFLDEKCQ